jgi:hypothetical protein
MLAANGCAQARVLNTIEITKRFSQLCCTQSRAAQKSDELFIFFIT